MCVHSSLVVWIANGAARATDSFSPSFWSVGPTCYQIVRIFVVPAVTGVNLS